jgi:hypothetical protein
MKTTSQNRKQIIWTIFAIGFALLLLLVSGSTAKAQWTNGNGNDVYKTNTAGNVGIGTTAPVAPLNIVQNSSTATQILLSNTSLGYSQIRSQYGTTDSTFSAGIKFLVDRTSDHFGSAIGFLTEKDQASQDYDYAMYIKNRNVGIGTTSPSQKLSVAVSSDYQGVEVLGTQSPAFMFSSSSSNSSARNWLVSTNANNYGDFTISKSASQGGSAAPNVGSAAFTILNSGNVGIGTTSPGANLAVSAGSPAIDLIETVQAPDSRIFQIAAGSQHLMIRASNDAHNSFIGVLGLARNGGLEIGSGYAASYTPPANGAIIQGNVGIGTPTPGYKLDINGDTHVTGNLNLTGTGNITLAGTINAKYQDVAEWVPSSEKLSAGTVVVLDSTKSNQVTSSSVSYDTRVAGVVSEQPGVALGEKSDSKVLVATTGRVRVKVDASKGAIHIGDLLVTSDVPGVAMKSEPVNLGGVQLHRPGTLIGKALEPLEKGKGEILVLLSLQ